MFQSNFKLYRRARVILFSMALLLLAGGMSIAQANVCEDTIYYDQTKTFTVGPAGSLEVCYSPNGQGTVEVGAKISWWEVWDNQNAPNVTVNVFWGTSSEATEFTYLSTISATTSWKYAPPLYLQQGIYVFSISTSALVKVQLNINPY